MKKLLIILLFFISNLYAFLTDPGVILTDPTKFIRKKFTNCIEFDKNIDDLYIYDNIYFFDEEYHPYSYYYYRPRQRLDALNFKRNNPLGTSYSKPRRGYLYTYNKDKYNWNLKFIENPLYYSKCLEDKLHFVESFNKNNLNFSLKKIVFFQPQKDYIIPSELQPDQSSYKKLHCDNLKDFIQKNSVNGSIYFVYFNTLYKVYLHKNGPLFMFVTENEGKDSYWSHNEGILNSLDGDFIYDGCYWDYMQFYNVKHRYLLHIYTLHINFIPLQQVHNNLLNPSRLQSSNYRTIEIKNCIEYNRFVTKDSNLINTGIYFKQEDVYFLIENSYLFMYKKNQWTMSSNNYSNPQCQNDYLMFDKIDDTDAILQQRIFALHKLKFFTFYQSKRGPGLSEKSQLEENPTEKEIYRGEELKEFVNGKLKDEY